eukprot:495321-Prorocentrum_minimum.AAC.1
MSTDVNQISFEKKGTAVGVVYRAQGPTRRWPLGGPAARNHVRLVATVRSRRKSCYVASRVVPATAGRRRLRRAKNERRERPNVYFGKQARGDTTRRRGDAETRPSQKV